MTRRMLINAQIPEELRIAIVTDSTLDTYQVEASEGGLTRGNIYRGIISNVQPSLNAAFIDYGAERNGFLAIQDVVEQAWYGKPKSKGRPKIEEVLKKNRPIVVQVTREAEGQKGAALSTNLSLAGRYLVLTPFDSTRGVSRKVSNDDDRKRLKQLAAKLNIPEDCGVIVRTNALEQNKTTLNRDLSALLRLWNKIQSEARKGKGTQLLYSDQDLVLQALRDYLDKSIGEVLVDSDEAYKKAEQYMAAFMPRAKTKLIRYKERTPLFTKFNLEPQIDRIYERRVELPSGGSIVIDRTEALTAIDVNSGRSTRASSQEETAVNTNLEAAREVARQLSLRDLGGLLVVDFIDMRSQKSRRKIEKAMRDALKADKARARVGRISSNGLLEINRQRINQALSLRTHRSCPTCAGTGRIASSEMVGLSLLRRIEARAVTGTLAKVRVALHPELADAVQNGRRQEIAALEKEFDVQVEVIAASHLHRAEQEVDWFSRAKPKDFSISSRDEASVQMADAASESESTADAAPQKDEQPTRRRRRRKTSPSARSKHEESASRSKKESSSTRVKTSEDDSKDSASSGRRRRRPRRGKGGDNTQDDTAKTASQEKQSKAAGQGEGDTQEDSKPTRRRRRRRSESGGQKSGTDRKAKADGRPDDDQASQREDASDNGGGRRRTRRRRGRSTSSKAGDSTAQGKEAGNGSRAKGQGQGQGQDGDDSSGSADQPRRRRRARRRASVDADA